MTSARRAASLTQRFADPSAPELPGIQPVDLLALASRLFHQVPRPSRSVATLTIPKTDEDDLLRTEARGGFQHPHIVASVRLFARLLRARLVRHHMQRCLRLRRKEALVPVRIGEVDGICQEGRLVKRDIEFKPHVAREAGFGKDQVSAACRATNREIARTGTRLCQCVDDRVPRNRLLVRREPRLLSSGGIDHVPAEKQDGAGYRTGIVVRHRWNPPGFAPGHSDDIFWCWLPRSSSAPKAAALDRALICDPVRIRSKYPPAEPGALGIGPLEAAVRVADAALHSLATRRWPISATNSFGPSGRPLAPVF